MATDLKRELKTINNELSDESAIFYEIPIDPITPMATSVDIPAIPTPSPPGPRKRVRTRGSDSPAREAPEKKKQTSRGEEFSKDATPQQKLDRRRHLNSIAQGARRNNQKGEWDRLLINMKRLEAFGVLEIPRAFTHKGNIAQWRLLQTLNDFLDVVVVKFGEKEAQEEEL